MRETKLCCLKVTTENVVTTLAIDNHWEAIVKAIDCSCLEVVTLPGYRYLVVLCDDDGLSAGKLFNAVGSHLYGFQVHGNPIVGDILLCYCDGSELQSMYEGEALLLKRTLIQQLDCIDGDHLLKIRDVDSGVPNG